ncbi:hypothetical protein SPRG_01683 [Saprolegnia parasitica CBS 223.65]|uniref:D-isomer specific 2-hydroxyacid dehydrogenase catalytic domain-containing protein n=1 Tax=Saprolegnia parasitica (strain CBS 223.65) TaxID=695850 RepID=A0A067CSY7_SAPPC|nr:hypothetical protein SPRG_01683 [Saprolegnia parasitica CBS 223.65]KDO33804.1 hypothetical protein SPRG_01683 [Saprolegnia parasitica CBS 223.65]|eukprot:XP_012195440.1 hypothetical protein SPRG_01683 [Saprolegnia parasitica CBS 223.65]
MLKSFVAAKPVMARTLRTALLSTKAPAAMRIAFFSDANYDTKTMQAMAAKEDIQHELHFFPHRLSLGTAPMAKDFDIAVDFVSGSVDAPVLKKLKEVGVRSVMLRSVGFDTVDLDSVA